MKNQKLKFLFPLVIAIILLLPEGFVFANSPDGYTASGGGDTNINGLYCDVGMQVTDTGDIAYTNGHFWLWRFSYPAWEIANGYPVPGAEYFYYIGSETSPVGLTWTQNSGALPAPSFVVSLGACPVFGGGGGSSTSIPSSTPLSADGQNNVYFYSIIIFIAGFWLIRTVI